MGKNGSGLYVLTLTADQLIALHQIVCVGRNPVNIQARSDVYNMVRDIFVDYRQQSMGIVDGKVEPSGADRVPKELVVVYSGQNRGLEGDPS